MSGIGRIDTEHECQARTRGSSILFDLDFSFPEQDQSDNSPTGRFQNRQRLKSSCLLCSWMSAEFPKLMAKLTKAEIELKERRDAETRRNILDGIMNQETDVISYSPHSSNKRSCNAEAIVELIKVKEDLLGAETRAVTLEREGLVLREEINRLKLQRSQLTDDEDLFVPSPNRKLIFSTAVCQVFHPEKVDPVIAKGGLTRRVQDLINEEYITMSELLQKELADQVAKVHDKLKRAQQIVVKSCTLATFVRYFKSWRFRIVWRKCAKRQKELRVKFTNAKDQCLQLRTFSLWNCKSLKRRQQFTVEKGCTIRRCFVKWVTLSSIEKIRSMLITQELEAQKMEIETERMAYQRQMMILQKDLTKAKVKSSERNRLYSEVKILRKRCNTLKKSLRLEKIQKLMTSRDTSVLPMTFYKWRFISFQQKSKRVLDEQMRFLCLKKEFQTWRKHALARIVPVRRAKRDAFRSWKIIAAMQMKYRKALAYEMMRLTWTTNVEMNRRLTLTKFISAWKTLPGKSSRARSCKLNRALKSQYNARLRTSMRNWQRYMSQIKIEMRSVLKDQVKSCEKRICKIQARQKRNTVVLASARANNLKELEKVARQASQEIQYKDAEHEREIIWIRQEMEERSSSYSQRLSVNQSVHARVLKVVIFRIWAAFSTKIARIKRARSIAIKKHIINVEELRNQLTVFMIWSRWKNLLYKKTRRQLDTADLNLAGKLPTPIHKLFTGFLNDWHNRKICIQSNSPQLTRSTSNDSL